MNSHAVMRHSPDGVYDPGMAPFQGEAPIPASRSVGSCPTLIRIGLALILSAASAHALAQSSCLPDEHTLCLNNSRFAVIAGFQISPSGPTFEANAVPLTTDSGYFWFFDPNNVELVVKVLNGCVEPFNSYWVFAAGLTNVQVDIAVTDTLRSETRTYTNPLGTAFLPIQDTSAFPTCP